MSRQRLAFAHLESRSGNTREGSESAEQMVLALLCKPLITGGDGNAERRMRVLKSSNDSSWFLLQMLGGRGSGLI